MNTAMLISGSYWRNQGMTASVKEPCISETGESATTSAAITLIGSLRVSSRVRPQTTGPSSANTMAKPSQN